MQGISKLAMGSAMVVALCLSLVFLLLLMLYVELCCSFLWRRRWRRRQLQTPLPTTAASCGGGVLPCTKPQKKLQGDDEVSTSPSDGQEGGSVGFSPLQKPAVSPTTAAAAYYGHGVLQTPSGFFFTTVPHPAALAASTKQGEGPGSKEMPLHFIGVIPSPRSATRRGAACDSGGSYTPEEHFVCISNPIYEGACSSTAAGDDGRDSGCTPFETPDTSPSRLEVDDGGDDDDDDDNEDEGELERCESSPAVKPMKKLPPALPLGTHAACLADGRRSLATSMSVTDTNRPSSSSSSNSPGTSPSW